MEQGAKMCAKAGCEKVFNSDPKQPRRLYCDEHFVGGAARDAGKSHKSKAEQAKVKRPRKAKGRKGGVPDMPGPLIPPPPPRAHTRDWNLQMTRNGVHIEIGGSTIHIQGEGLTVRVLET